jgi:hypothetical protein
MSTNYQGLPAAASVEQAIVLAQLLILRDLRRREQTIAKHSNVSDGDSRSVVTDRRA